MAGVNEQVVDSVTIGNTKTFGDGPAFYAQLAMGNAVSHQKTMQSLDAAASAAMVKLILSVSPEQAVSDNKLMTGNDLASQLAALMAALSSSQQGAKVAQTTPPESAAK